MTFMIEVYYDPPNQPVREAAIDTVVAAHHGRPDYREALSPSIGICLTYEFPTWVDAEQAADALRNAGEHVEGPSRYT